MNRKYLLIIAAALVLGLLFLAPIKQPTAPGKQAATTTTATTTAPSAPVTVTFDKAEGDVRDTPDKVKKVTFVKSGPVDAVQSVQVEMTDGSSEVAAIPGEAASKALFDLANARKNITIDTVTAPKPDTGGGLFSMIGYLLPLILIFFVFRMMSGGGAGPMSKFTQSKAKKFEPDANPKNFEDVAGCDNAKRELIEIVDYLKDPKGLIKLGGRRTKGVLLVGPPGNGKTLLAKAVAGEAGVPFFSISGSDFVEMFVGVGAGRVRDLFNTGREHQPCVIFIDEIDAVGRQRGTGLGGGNDEREQTLNQILVEMDGFLANESIVLIAATNRPDILDPALVRPGRFDMQVLVEEADQIGRFKILKVHTRKMTLAKDVDLDFIALQTPGYSGADLEGTCAQAAIVANRRIKDTRAKLIQEGKTKAEAEALVPDEVTLEDMDEGATRVKMGPPSDKTLSPYEEDKVAHHETGHAWMSQVEHDEGNGGDPVVKLTVQPRAKALGYMLSLPKGDRYNFTDKELRARIKIALGGRVAQEEFGFGSDTGASNDFQQATNIAYRMVMEFGMSKLGPIYVSNNNTNPFLGRSMAMDKTLGHELQNDIDNEVRRIVNECYEETKKQIHADRACFAILVQALKDKKTLLGPQFEKLFRESTCRQPKVGSDGRLLAAPAGTGDTAAAPAEAEACQNCGPDCIGKDGEKK